jgi:hypothetical protein
VASAGKNPHVSAAAIGIDNSVFMDSLRLSGTFNL